MSVDENILAESSEDTLVGTLFADAYEIVSVLGKGGMSVVYKARYVPLDQLVAVKVMHAHMAATPATLQRLKQEAKLCSTLAHPNIVRVLRLHISDDGYPFLVAELLEGRTIQQAIRRDGPFDETRFQHVFSQVLDALEYAHARGIIHRDIKPSNLMLTRQVAPDGSESEDIVKIVDFGISKMLSDSAAITQGITQSNSGNIFGSPPYMSPEQCTGGRSDNRSDLYAVACVMYEALTGRQAFNGDTALDTMFQQVHDLPPSFALAAPGRVIPAHLESAVFAALRKDPGERPQSVGELRGTLLGKAPPRQRAGLTRAGRKGLRMLAVVALAAAAGLLLIKLGHLPTPSGEAGLDTTGSGTDKQQAAAIKPLTFSESPLGCYNQGEDALHDRTRSPQENHAIALRYFQRANQLLAHATKQTTNRRDVLNIKQRLGSMLEAVGKHDEATAYLLEALAIGNSISSPGQEAMICASLTTNYTSRKQPDKAMKYALLCVKYNEEQRREFPNQTWPIRNCIDAYLCLASCYQSGLEFDKAETTIRKTLELADEQENTMTRLLVMRTMAAHCSAQDRNLESKDWMEHYFKLESMPGTEAELAEIPAQAHELYAISLQRLGHLPQARKEYETACRLASQTYPQHPDTMKGVLAPMLTGKAVNSYIANDIDGGDRDIAASIALYKAIGNLDGAKIAETTVQQARANALIRVAKRGLSPKTGK